MTSGRSSEVVTTASLRYFEEVARAGSIRRAAEAIRIAPSAISRQIHRLESELQAELFERTRHGLRLTAAGEALLMRARRAMKELDAARAEIGALRGPHGGQVRIGVNDTVAREFLSHFLLQFSTAHPQVRFAVTVANTATLVELMLRDEIEIMIGYSVPDRAGLSRVVSFDLDTCVMLQRRHPLARRRWLHVADLVDHKLIMPDETSTLRQVIDAMLEQAMVRPRSVMTTNSFELMAQLAEGGLGLGVQFRLAPGPDRLRPDLMYVPLRHPEVRPAVLACCVRSRRRPTTAAARCTAALREMLQAWSQAHGAPASGRRRSRSG